MIADHVRMDAYVQALYQAVKPGSVVVDIGTGTGTFALLACHLGARQVYAIEIGDVIQVAREIAAANGYAERIAFIQNHSTQVTLPERADVIVSDLHGVLPLFQHHLPSIADARRRFLGPGGVLIPQHDTLWLAVVEAPDLYSQYTAPWDDHGYGLDMEAARRLATNMWRKGRVRPEQLLVEPRCWATLDYRTLESPDVCAEVTCTAARAGIAHGLIVWFDAALAEGVYLSNAPGQPESIFGSAFFPWSTPVRCAVGDTVCVTLEATLVGEDYTWRWNTRVLNQGHAGQVKANFKQSTFFGVPLSPERLRRRADSYVPTLNEDGQIDRLILELMSDHMSLATIAGRLSAQFPSRFATRQDALTRVAELSEQYSQ
jgi:protein arginine N-methyltransferase 1